LSWSTNQETVARPSNTEQRRAEIATALVKVMAQHGYDKASVASVAGAAGLSPGLVHYHFRSKHEILLEALERLATGSAARLEARLSDAGDEVAAFLDFHLGLGADADPDALACWIMLSGEALRDRAVQAAYQRAIAGQAARLTRAIRAGVSAGRYRCANPEAAAGALIAVIQGYFVLGAAARAVIPRGSAAGAARRMAAGLLGAPLAAARRRKARR
jgi:TetR/AcrR family transcriptional repressor of bet genes